MYTSSPAFESTRQMQSNVVRHRCGTLAPRTRVCECSFDWFARTATVFVPATQLDVHERSEEDDLSIDEDRNVIIRRLGHAVGFRRFRRAQTALGCRVRRSGRRVGETRVAACGCDRLGGQSYEKVIEISS